jgi:DNA-binding GntR family transcriptional regulator
MGSELDLKSIVGEAHLSRPMSLAEEAANTLREMILLEKLPAGMALPERDLSDVLGISRTPLREAIRILAHEGLIEFSASRRPRVADPTISEITNHLRIQGALEALSGELACVTAMDDELRHIASLNEEMIEQAGREEPVAAFKRDMAFHSAIVIAAKNEPLVETHKSNNARLWRARFMSSQRKVSRKSTASEHTQIVDALLRRDGPAAAKALKRHLKTAETNIANAIAERDNQQ